MGILSDLGVDDEEMADLAKRLLSEKKWLHENYKKISEEYANRFVAAEKNVIIDFANDMESLIQSLKKKNRNINTVLIELINSKKRRFNNLSIQGGIKS